MSGFNMQSLTQTGKDYKIDPVCGMKVDSIKPPFQARYKNEIHYFCSEACKHLFEREPGKYVEHLPE
jgi:P-type Cu+ transporter